jgi:hypothetical protein
MITIISIIIIDLLAFFTLLSVIKKVLNHLE